MQKKKKIQTIHQLYSPPLKEESPKRTNQVKSIRSNVDYIYFFMCLDVLKCATYNKNLRTFLQIILFPPHFSLQSQKENVKRR
jgi:hypothetical protein